MECRHVRKYEFLNKKTREAILTPANWACMTCGTTESIWACLQCPHVACGQRDNEAHAFKHFTAKGHPLVMEITEKSIHCYLCDDYVLNDTDCQDFQLLREALASLQQKRIEGSRTRSGRLLRQASVIAASEEGDAAADYDAMDREQSADMFYRHLQLSHCFGALRASVQAAKRERQSRTDRASEVELPLLVDGAELAEVPDEHSLAADESRPPQAPGEAPTAALPFVPARAQPAASLSSLAALTVNVSHAIQALAGDEVAARVFSRAPLKSCLKAPSPAPIPRSPMPNSVQFRENELQPPPAILIPMGPEEPKPPAPPRARVTRGLTPGMTGLRNIGQTCFMNAVLQTLAHSELLRELLSLLGEQGFLDPTHANMRIAAVQEQQTQAPAPKPSSAIRHRIFRQTTVECRDILEMPSPSLSATGRKRRAPVDSPSPARASQGAPANDGNTDNAEVALCHDLESLFRVLWSGKWSVITPHAILQDIWKIIPSFRGYQQQDAEELMCELGERLQSEVDRLQKRLHPVTIPALTLLRNALGGQSSSAVTCLNCNYVSRRSEPFLDLSLDFPSDDNELDVEDFLKFFTRSEEFDGAIFECDKCSRAKSGALTYRKAKRTCRISTVPGLLRLHFKRFRWSGSRREKIMSHVRFSSTLDIQKFTLDPQADPFQTEPTSLAASARQTPADSPFVYDLIGAIVHHGRGINSGHYTSYCLNPVTKAWTHCNDARISTCRLSDVMQENVYILIYSNRYATQSLRQLRESPTLLTPVPTPSTSPSPPKSQTEFLAKRSNTSAAMLFPSAPLLAPSGEPQSTIATSLPQDSPTLLATTTNAGASPKAEGGGDIRQSSRRTRGVARSRELAAIAE
eukprot:m.467851 g.467851  ORF g.467851 m.467851 type:complete len:862 (+) comp57066_c0_seq2:226-2811(+)